MSWVSSRGRGNGATRHEHRLSMSLRAVPLIEIGAARALFLQHHGLGTLPSGPAKGQALSDLIENLGFVQVDSVNTFARAHDHILWSRRQSYKPASLRWLNDRARGVFEHWTHDASVIPVSFFPYWRLKFERDRAKLHSRWKTWHGGEFHSEIDGVLRHIREHGAVCSSEMSEKRVEKSTGWWDWHPGKAALEYLWRSGDLAITRRDGFRKFYDLSERVIPPEHLNARFETDTIIDWACAAALDRLGFATSGELAAFFALITPAEAKTWVAQALASRRLAEANIQGCDGKLRRVVLWPEVLASVDALAPIPKRLRILSPFDPALRDRKRAERLFGFHYRIEIFVPEAQRKYGYYVFPVMEGDRMIGRIDMKADRTEGVLNVTGFWPEVGITMGKARLARLEAELDRAARFSELDRVVLCNGWLRAAA